MKLVTLLVLPHHIYRLRDELTQLNVPGITITEVRVQNTCKKCATCPKNNWHTMTQIEMAVSDDLVEPIKRCVLSTIGTSGKDSGEKMVVSPLEDVVRVRTNEHGEHAL